ncbi:MAG: adenylate/guanylate cyclase domain-containing protein [Aeromicrobium sp.]|nr:adenylate/guanylate cyclase domain-containing protein [Burkholderiales bacterium]
MLKFINRVPIGQKFIGLIAFLLAIMLVIATYSEYVAKKSGEELEDLTQYLVPPQRSLEKIALHLLEQQVLEERMLRLASAPVVNDALVEKELAAFKELSATVGGEILAIEAALADTLKRVNEVNDAIALARLQAAMPQIDKERQTFERQVLSTVELVRKNKSASATAAIDELAREQRGIYDLLEATESSFADFINQQAALVMEHERKRALLGHENLLVAIAAFFIGVLLAVVITRRMLLPIRQLIDSSNAVAKGDLTVNVEPTTQDEIGKLAIAFRDMTLGLREREAIKLTFSQYVDPRIVRHLLAPGSSDKEGERRNMTVFFSDIANFTTIAEQLTPQSLVRLLNAYLVEMSKPIAIGQGVIDKFIGDAIMAYWGEPFVKEDEHPTLAVRAGLQMFEFLDRFRAQIPDVTGLRTGAPDIDIRIGIATGPVLIGNMGSASMKNYTIIGDTVNLAARLEGACKEYGVRFLISDGTYARTGDAFLVREIDVITAKGKQEPVKVFEPLCEMEMATAPQRRLVSMHASAMAAYRSQRWDEAETDFQTLLSAYPEDGPAGEFIKRIRQMREHPPGSQWDGSWQMQTK